MRTIIFETGHHGHRLTYVGLVARALAELPGVTATLVLGSDAEQHDAFRSQIVPALDAFPEQIDVVLTTNLPRTSRVRLALARNRALNAAIRDHRPDRVYIPTADGLIQAMGATSLIHRRPPCAIEAAVHTGLYAVPDAPGGRGIRASLSARLLAAAPCQRVFHVNPIGYDTLTRMRGSIARRVRLLPDPVEAPPALDRTHARTRLGVPTEGRFIGCVGSIDRNKGMDILIRSFARASASGGLDGSDRLLLAGKHRPDIRDVLDADAAHLVEAGRIISIDRYLDNDELASALGALDIVCTPYPAHLGLSNIALRAVFAERFVLASDFGWLGAIVPRFGLGSVVAAGSADDLAQRMPAMFQAAGAWSPSPAAAALRRFHDPSNFAASWTAGAREALGLPPDPAAVSWDDVLAASP